MCVIVYILPFTVIYVCIFLSFAFTLVVNSCKCTEFNECSLGNILLMQKGELLLDKLSCNLLVYSYYLCIKSSM